MNAGRKRVYAYENADEALREECPLLDMPAEVIALIGEWLAGDPGDLARFMRTCRRFAMEFGPRHPVWDACLRTWEDRLTEEVTFQRNVTFGYRYFPDVHRTGYFWNFWRVEPPFSTFRCRGLEWRKTGSFTYETTYRAMKDNWISYDYGKVGGYRLKFRIVTPKGTVLGTGVIPPPAPLLYRNEKGTPRSRFKALWKRRGRWSREVWPTKYVMTPIKRVRRKVK